MKLLGVIFLVILVVTSLLASHAYVYTRAYNRADSLHNNAVEWLCDNGKLFEHRGKVYRCSKAVQL